MIETPAPEHRVLSDAEKDALMATTLRQMADDPAECRKIATSIFHECKITNDPTQEDIDVAVDDLASKVRNCVLAQLKHD